MSLSTIVGDLSTSQGQAAFAAAVVAANANATAKFYDLNETGSSSLGGLVAYETYLATINPGSHIYDKELFINNNKRLIAAVVVSTSGWSGIKLKIKENYNNKTIRAELDYA